MCKHFINLDYRLIETFPFINKCESCGIECYVVYSFHVEKYIILELEEAIRISKSHIFQSIGNIITCKLCKIYGYGNLKYQNKMIIGMTHLTCDEVQIKNLLK
jgi:hypothetical protein